MASGYESRRFTRSDVRIPVSLVFGEGTVVQGRIVNLSMRGMFVEVQGKVPVGGVCEVSFDASATEPIRLRCKVVGVHATGIGLEITGIDSTSFDSLRELIVKYSDEPSACDTQILANYGSLPELF